MIKNAQVLIVGAGAAGIAAACRLIERGFRNVIILEAENRIGGRVYTTKFGDNVIEIGAEWVHGEHGNISYKLSSPHNLLESSKTLQDNSYWIFADSKGRIIPKDQSTQMLDLYLSIIYNLPESLKKFKASYGDYFTEEYNKALKKNPFTDPDRANQFLNWIHKYENIIEASDSWFQVSGSGMMEYSLCDGDPVLNWKGKGYKTLFDVLMRKLPTQVDELPVLEKVRFNHEVSNIDYSQKNRVIVKTTNNSEYIADHVIFTASLGVLKEQHDSLFTPFLPVMKRRTIEGLGFGTVDKIFFEFPYTWWSEYNASFNIIWSDEDRRKFVKSVGKENEWLGEIFHFSIVDHQPRLLTAWLTGPCARHVEDLPDDVVIKGFHYILEKFFGTIYNIPKPDKVLRSAWGRNKHFRGSYSFRSMESTRLDVWAKDLAEPITDSNNKPVILFGGEATHDHYYSTVHGAVESGFREADRLVEYYGISQNINNKMQGSPWQPTEITKVVIIGGGISGLAAAKTLEADDCEDYILLEAQEKLGGRIDSIPWNNSWIECGAQWLNGGENELAKVCRYYKLLGDFTFKKGEGSFLRDDGLRINDCLVKDIDSIVRYTLEEPESLSNQDAGVSNNSLNVGRALRSKLRNHLRLKSDPLTIRDMREEIFDWYVRSLMIDNACFTLDELSVKNLGRSKESGDMESLNFKTGYSSIIKFIAQGLNERNIRLNSPVETIEWSQTFNRDDVNRGNIKPVVVRLADKRDIFADCVIVTCSLGFLKENYKKMFNPKLPLHLSQGIENLGFGLINKIFLDFGEPWWSLDSKGFQLVWSKNGHRIFSKEKLATWTRDLTGFDIVQGHKAVLVGWVGGRGAHVVEMLSENQIANDCINLLRHFVKREDIPAPKRCKRTQWNSNKYMKGSCSYISVNSDPSAVTKETLNKPVWCTITHKGHDKCTPIIMLAGEATHEHYYSTTHGAFETGIQQAKTFLQHYSEKKLL